MIWEIDESRKVVEGLDDDGRPDPAYAAALGLRPAPLGRRALASIIEEHVAAVAAVARPRADGTLPIHIVTAAHRRRPEAQPRKTRAGPPRA